MITNPRNLKSRGKPGGVRAAVNQRMLVAVATVLLLFAGWMLWRQYGANPIPADSSTWVYFRCQNCKAEFHLNAREIDAMLRGRRTAMAEDGKTMLVPCPNCKQTKAETIIKPR